ncbi:uncharacterized protein LOC111013220 [Momordica charantia]|uniref:Uncharacterized protein LOC111013220 n=1 Tax=Momordica charantia TaxID=3673 RepID=A0A6J1CNZ5_MOMCH|nr:uncharacterized protein LOC111013220 [Momordica charantia]
MFTYDEVKTILSIPLGIGLAADRLIWNFEKNGICTVKSDYKLAHMQSPDTSASTSLSECLAKWWKDVWQLNLPSKIKVFFWRPCLDRLPTGANLILRGVDVPDCYAFCGKKGEDALHLFWTCKVSKNQRQVSKFSHLPQDVRPLSLLHLLRDCEGILSWSDFEELVVFLWGIWSKRNVKVFLNGREMVRDLDGWERQSCKFPFYMFTT